MRKAELLAGLALGAFLIAAAPASAEAPAAPEAAAAVDDDPSAIVVTAQRREQNIQSVPLAVSAISEKSLQRQQAVSTYSLLRLFPNVSGAQVTGAGANNYSIRGLSNAETAATFDSPVGTYIDGVYLARINANNFALFDVDRIEVLRGPQGTLFGRNTTGGAISIVLKKPSSKLGASVEAEGGNYSHYQVRGSVDLPISSSLRTRFAAYKLDEDGYAKNRTTGGTNNGHEGWGARAAVSADLNSNITWDVAADYVHDVNPYIPATKVDGKFVTYSGLQALGSIVSGRKGGIGGNYVGNNSWGVTSDLKMDTAIGNLEFITAYRHLQNSYNIDYFDNPSVIGGYDSVQYGIGRQFSQEVKLSGTALNGKLDYTAGLYYFHEYNFSDFTTVFRLASGTPFVDADRKLYNTTDSYAGYVQGDYHLTEKLTLTAGIRLTTEDKALHYVNNNNPRASVAITDQTLINGRIPLQQAVTLPTPRVALTYKPNEDIMMYASATRGFKSGGWNIRATTATLLRNFAPEKVWSYEGGLRTKWLDGKATANFTGFYASTTNLQIATAVATTASAAPVFPVGNFSDFRSYGGEFEGTIAPIHGLSIFANLGYNKTKYVNPTTEVVAQQAACVASITAGLAARPNCGAGIVTTTGGIAKPLRAPKVTTTLGFSYEIPLNDRWQVVPSMSGRYVSSFNANSAALPTTEDNGYFMLSSGLAVETQDQKIRFSVGCENCNNTSYLVSVISGHAFISAPRRWFGRVGYKF